MNKTEAVLNIQPQARFLWQVSNDVEAFCRAAEEKFGCRFSFGYDGVCLAQSRRLSPGVWNVSVDEVRCMLQFSDEASLRAGYAFLLNLIGQRPDGSLFLPFGTWCSSERNLGS